MSPHSADSALNTSCKCYEPHSCSIAYGNVVHGPYAVSIPAACRVACAHTQQRVHTRPHVLPYFAWHLSKTAHADTDSAGPLTFGNNAQNAASCT